MKLVKDFIPFFLCLLIMTTYVKAQNSTKIYNTKDLNILDRNRKISAKKKSYSEAIKFTKTLIEYYNVNNIKDSLKKNYNRLGFYYVQKKLNDSAYYYYQKARDSYLKENDSLKVAKILKELAVIESKKEMYLLSDSTCVEALKYIREKRKNIKTVTSLYNNLGINSNEIREYQQAIEWYNKALDIVKDRRKKLRYTSNKATNYIKLEKYPKAIKLYEEILIDGYWDSIPLKLKGKVIDNYAYTKFLAKQKTSVKDFLKAQQIKKEINDEVGLIANYSHLSDFYARTNPEKSLEYANKMYNLAKKLELPDDLVKAIDKILTVDNKDVKKLMLLARKAIRIKDSVSLGRLRSRNKIAKIRYNYDEERHQKEKAQLARKQENTEKWIILLVGILIMIILLSYIYDRKQKAEKAKLIEVYNTETRLAKRIHDELANDVYRTMHQVQQNETLDPVVLQNLEKIYLQTRDISHENSLIVTGKDFGNSIKQLLADFTTPTCKIMSNGLEDIAVHTLKKEQQIVLYRVLQELLVNMKKHSEASMVVITFKADSGHIYVKYKDNGIGADTLSLKNGLENMETRIKSIKGTITFETEATKGFLTKFHFKK